MHPVSYILPLRSREAPTPEFVTYVNNLAAVVEVLLVDGSSEAVFAALEGRCLPGVIHVRPDAEFSLLQNGKVRGVLTGLRLARHDTVIIADDDVRYTVAGLVAVAAALESADVVRPQNYFAPLPWHATIDTARMLINRVTGGDWPGTLGVRRSTLARAGGYDGNVLFENLELVRTVQAVGGREASRPDLFVRRLPPSARHFWRQRIRQAYDEFARPGRLMAALAVLPLLLALGWRRHYLAALSAILILPVGLAEAGRRRSGGANVFPWSTSLCAPVWILERGACAWIALGLRLTAGGVSYNGQRVGVAAHSRRTLARRLGVTAPSSLP